MLCSHIIALGKSKGKKSESSLQSGLALHHLVQEYFRRNMSLPSDKLPAIAALAQDYAERRKTEYCAGLWKGSMSLDLLWIVQSVGLIDRRPSTYAAPSWSWAVVDEPVI